MQIAYKGCVLVRFFKKIIPLILCLCLFVGCSGREKLSANDIADEIKSLSSDLITWISLDKSQMSTYFSIQDDTVIHFAGYINDSENKFDIIAVFKFENQDARTQIISEINKTATQMSDNYKLANENEAQKISNHIIAQTNDTIIFCVLDNQKPITEYLTSEVKAEILNH